MNIRDIDLNLLLVFESIYISGSISRAAESLELSQPALSNALARLRKQMNDQLFVRSGNGVVPTVRAEEIIVSVRDALTIIRQGINPGVEFDPKVSKRHFRLIIADPLEQVIMPKLIQNIGRESQITFELQPPQSLQIEESLLSGATDFAAFLLHGKYPELSSKPLCTVELVVIARHGHPRIGSPVSMPELSREGYVTISLAPGKLKNSEKVTFWQRLHLREVCQVYKVGSIGQLVAQTDLIGIVPRIYANQVAKEGGVQVIDLPIELSNQQFHMIWHKRNEVDSGVTWLREQVKSCFPQNLA